MSLPEKKRPNAFKKQTKKIKWEVCVEGGVRGKETGKTFYAVEID